MRRRMPSACLAARRCPGRLARAQQPKMLVIGFLNTRTPEDAVHSLRHSRPHCLFCLDFLWVKAQS
jgi:hypothetical protein